MRQRMRADLVAGGEPVADLRGVHQAFGHFTLAHLPVVQLAKPIGDEKFHRTETMSLHRLDGVTQHIFKTVVECERDRRRGCFAGFANGSQ